MRRVLLLFGAALVGGAGAGWLTAPHADLAATPAPLELAQPVHAGVAAAEARMRLEQLHATLPAEEALEAPPPPDITVLFRRDLTAIEQRPDGPIVWIVDFAAEFGRRGLKIGDVYQDGWRLSAVAGQYIELRRRRETKRVTVFEAPPSLEP